MSKSILKLVAVFTLVCFLGQESGYAQTASLPSAEISRLPITLLELIPAQTASLEEYWKPEGTSQSDTVILIEDAHGHFQAQENIEKTLNYLQTTVGFETLFLEGGVGTLDPSYLEFFEDSNANEEVIRALERAGEIGGPELFIAKSHRGEKIYGAEDLDLYIRNVHAYQNAVTAREQIRGIMDAQLLEWQRSASRILQPSLYQFVKAWLAYEAEQTDLSAWLNALEESAAEILDLDLNDRLQQFEWPMLVRFAELRTRQSAIDPAAAEQDRSRLLEWCRQHNAEEEAVAAIESGVYKKSHTLRKFWEKFHYSMAPRGFRYEDYPSYFEDQGFRILEQELESADFMEEMRRLRDRVLNAWTKTESENQMLESLGRLIELEKLLNLKMSSEEFSDFVEQTEEHFEGLHKELAEPFQQALIYYRLALQRDQAMLHQLRQRMAADKSSTAVLVAGGFHTEGIKHFLKLQQTAYAVLRPHLTSVQEDTGYEEAMLGREESWGLMDSTVRVANFMNSVPFWQKAGLNMSRRSGYLRDIDAWGRKAGYARTLNAIPAADGRSELRTKTEHEFQVEKLLEESLQGVDISMAASSRLKALFQIHFPESSPAASGEGAAALTDFEKRAAEEVDEQARSQARQIMEHYNRGNVDYRTMARYFLNYLALFNRNLKRLREDSVQTASEKLKSSADVSIETIEAEGVEFLRDRERRQQNDGIIRVRNAGVSSDGDLRSPDASFSPVPILVLRKAGLIADHDVEDFHEILTTDRIPVRSNPGHVLKSAASIPLRRVSLKVPSDSQFPPYLVMEFSRTLPGYGSSVVRAFLMQKKLPFRPAEDEVRSDFIRSQFVFDQAQLEALTIRGDETDQEFEAKVKALQAFAGEGRLLLDDQYYLSAGNESVKPETAVTVPDLERFSAFTGRNHFQLEGQSEADAIRYAFYYTRQFHEYLDRNYSVANRLFTQNETQLRADGSRLDTQRIQLAGFFVNDDRLAQIKEVLAGDSLLALLLTPLFAVREIATDDPEVKYTEMVLNETQFGTLLKTYKALFSHALLQKIDLAGQIDKALDKIEADLKDRLDSAGIAEIKTAFLTEVLYRIFFEAVSSDQSVAARDNRPYFWRAMLVETEKETGESATASRLWLMTRSGEVTRSLTRNYQNSLNILWDFFLQDQEQSSGSNMHVASEFLANLEAGLYDENLPASLQNLSEKDLIGKIGLMDKSTTAASLLSKLTGYTNAFLKDDYIEFVRAKQAYVENLSRFRDDLIAIREHYEMGRYEAALEIASKYVEIQGEDSALTEEQLAGLSKQERRKYQRKMRKQDRRQKEDGTKQEILPVPLAGGEDALKEMVLRLKSAAEALEPEAEDEADAEQDETVPAIDAVSDEAVQTAEVPAVEPVSQLQEAAADVPAEQTPLEAFRQIQGVGPALLKMLTEILTEAEKMQENGSSNLRQYHKPFFDYFLKNEDGHLTELEKEAWQAAFSAFRDDYNSQKGAKFINESIFDLMVKHYGKPHDRPGSYEHIEDQPSKALTLMALNIARVIAGRDADQKEGFPAEAVSLQARPETSVEEYIHVFRDYFHYQNHQASHLYNTFRVPAGKTAGNQVNPVAMLALRRLGFASILTPLAFVAFEAARKGVQSIQLIPAADGFPPAIKVIFEEPVTDFNLTAVSFLVLNRPLAFRVDEDETSAVVLDAQELSRFVFDETAEPAVKETAVYALVNALNSHKVLPAASYAMHLTRENASRFASQVARTPAEQWALETMTRLGFESSSARKVQLQVSEDLSAYDDLMQLFAEFGNPSAALMRGAKNRLEQLQKTHLKELARFDFMKPLLDLATLIEDNGKTQDWKLSPSDSGKYLRELDQVAEKILLPALKALREQGVFDEQDASKLQQLGLELGLAVLQIVPKKTSGRFGRASYIELLKESASRLFETNYSGYQSVLVPAEDEIKKRAEIERNQKVISDELVKSAEETRLDKMQAASEVLKSQPDTAAFLAISDPEALRESILLFLGQKTEASARPKAELLDKLLDVRGFYESGALGKAADLLATITDGSVFQESVTVLGDRIQSILGKRNEQFEKLRTAYEQAASAERLEEADTQIQTAAQAREGVDFSSEQAAEVNQLESKAQEQRVFLFYLHRKEEIENSEVPDKEKAAAYFALLLEYGLDSENLKAGSRIGVDLLEVAFAIEDLDGSAAMTPEQNYQLQRIAGASAELAGNNEVFQPSLEFAYDALLQFEVRDEEKEKEVLAQLKKSFPASTTLKKEEAYQELVNTVRRMQSQSAGITGTRIPEELDRIAELRTRIQTYGKEAKDRRAEELYPRLDQLELYFRQKQISTEINRRFRDSRPKGDSYGFFRRIHEPEIYQMIRALEKDFGTASAAARQSLIAEVEKAKSGLRSELRSTVQIASLPELERALHEETETYLRYRMVREFLGDSFASLSRRPGIKVSNTQIRAYEADDEGERETPGVEYVRALAAAAGVSEYLIDIRTFREDLRSEPDARKRYGKLLNLWDAYVPASLGEYPVSRQSIADYAKGTAKKAPSLQDVETLLAPFDIKPEILDRRVLENKLAAEPLLHRRLTLAREVLSDSMYTFARRRDVPVSKSTLPLYESADDKTRIPPSEKYVKALAGLTGVDPARIWWGKTLKEELSQTPAVYERLIKVRQYLGFNQRALSKQRGVHASTSMISLYEHEEVRKRVQPSEAYTKKLASLAGIQQRLIDPRTFQLEMREKLRGLAEVHERLETVRKDAGLSISETAAISGLSVSEIKKFESPEKLEREEYWSRERYIEKLSAYFGIRESFFDREFLMRQLLGEPKKPRALYYARLLAAETARELAQKMPLDITEKNISGYEALNPKRYRNASAAYVQALADLAGIQPEYLDRSLIIDKIIKAETRADRLFLVRTFIDPDLENFIRRYGLSWTADQILEFEKSVTVPASYVEKLSEISGLAPEIIDARFLKQKLLMQPVLYKRLIAAREFLGVLPTPFAAYKEIPVTAVSILDFESSDSSRRKEPSLEYVLALAGLTGVDSRAIDRRILERELLEIKTPAGKYRHLRQFTGFSADTFARVFSVENPSWIEAFEKGDTSAWEPDSQHWKTLAETFVIGRGYLEPEYLVSRLAAIENVPARLKYLLNFLQTDIRGFKNKYQPRATEGQIGRYLKGQYRDETEIFKDFVSRLAEAAGLTLENVLRPVSPATTRIPASAPAAEPAQVWTSLDRLYTDLDHLLDDERKSAKDTRFKTFQKLIEHFDAAEAMILAEQDNFSVRTFYRAAFDWANSNMAMITAGLAQRKVTPDFVNRLKETAARFGGSAELMAVIRDAAARFELRAATENFDYSQYARQVMSEEARVFVGRMAPYLDEEQKSSLAAELVSEVSFVKPTDMFAIETFKFGLGAVMAVMIGLLAGTGTALLGIFSWFFFSAEASPLWVFTATAGVTSGYLLALLVSVYMPSLIMRGLRTHKGIDLHFADAQRLTAERDPYALGSLAHEWMHSLKAIHGFNDVIASSVQVLVESEIHDLRGLENTYSYRLKSSRLRMLDRLWTGGREAVRERNVLEGFVAMKNWLNARDADVTRKLLRAAKPRFLDYRGIRFFQVWLSGLLTLGMASRENYSYSYRLGGMAIALAQYAPESNNLAWHFLRMISQNVPVISAIEQISGERFRYEAGDVPVVEMPQELQRTLVFDFESRLPGRSELRVRGPEKGIRRTARSIDEVLAADRESWQGFRAVLNRVISGSHPSPAFAGALLRIYDSFPASLRFALSESGRWQRFENYLYDVAASENLQNPEKDRLLILQDVDAEARRQRIQKAFKLRESMGLTPALIHEAQDLLDEFDVIKKDRPTPLREHPKINRVMSRLLGREVRILFKDETVNPTGSFKDRAPILMYKRIRDNIKQGTALPDSVAVVSTGNHAAASTVAVRRFAENYYVRNTGEASLPVSVEVYMGKDAEPHKVDRVRELGGNVILTTEDGSRIGSYMEAEDLVESRVDGEQVIQVRHADEYVVAGYAVGGGLELPQQLRASGVITEGGRGENIALLWDVGSGGFYAGAQEILRSYPDIRTYGVSAPPASLTFESVRNKLAGRSDPIVRRAVPSMNNDGIAATPEAFAVDILTELSDGLLTVPDDSTIGFVALIESYLRKYGSQSALESEHTTAMPLVAILLNQDLFQDRDVFVIPVTSQNRSRRVSQEAWKRFLSHGIPDDLVVAFYKAVQRSELRSITGYAQEITERGTIWAGAAVLSALFWQPLLAFTAAYAVPLVITAGLVLAFYYVRSILRRVLLADYPERVQAYRAKVREFKQNAGKLNTVRDIIRERERLFKEFDAAFPVKKAQFGSDFNVAAILGSKILKDVAERAADNVIFEFGYELLQAQRRILLRKGFSDAEIRKAHVKDWPVYRFKDRILTLPGRLLWSSGKFILGFLRRLVPDFSALRSRFKNRKPEAAPSAPVKDAEPQQPEKVQLTTVAPKVETVVTEPAVEEPVAVKTDAVPQPVQPEAPAPETFVAQSVREFFEFFEKEIMSFVRMAETKKSAEEVKTILTEYERRVRLKMDQTAAHMSRKDQQAYKQIVSQDKRVTSNRQLLQNRISYLENRQRTGADFDREIERVRGLVADDIRQGKVRAPVEPALPVFRGLFELIQKHEIYSPEEVAGFENRIARLAESLERQRETEAQKRLRERMRQLEENLTQEAEALRVSSLDFGAHPRIIEFKTALENAPVQEGFRAELLDETGAAVVRIAKVAANVVSDPARFNKAAAELENPLALAEVFEQGGHGDWNETLFEIVSGRDLAVLLSGAALLELAESVVLSLEASRRLGAIYETRGETLAAFHLYQDELDFLRVFMNPEILADPRVVELQAELTQRMYQLNPLSDEITELEIPQELEVSLPDASTTRNLRRYPQFDSDDVNDILIDENALLEHFEQVISHRFSDRPFNFDEIINYPFTQSVLSILAQYTGDENLDAAFLHFREALSRALKKVFETKFRVFETLAAETRIRAENAADIDGLADTELYSELAELFESTYPLRILSEDERFNALVESDQNFPDEIVRRLDEVIAGARQALDYRLSMPALEWFFKFGKDSVWVDETLPGAFAQANRIFNLKRADEALELYRALLPRIRGIADEKTRPNLQNALYGFVYSRIAKAYRFSKRINMAEDAIEEGLNLSPWNLYLEMESVRTDLESSKARRDPVEKAQDLEQAQEKADRLLRYHDTLEPVVVLYVETLIAAGKKDEANTAVNRYQRRRVLSNDAAQNLKKRIGPRNELREASDSYYLSHAESIWQTGRNVTAGIFEFVYGGLLAARVQNSYAAEQVRESEAALTESETVRIFAELVELLRSGGKAVLPAELLLALPFDAREEFVTLLVRSAAAVKDLQKPVIYFAGESAAQLKEEFYQYEAVLENPAYKDAVEIRLQSEAVIARRLVRDPVSVSVSVGGISDDTENLAAEIPAMLIDSAALEKLSPRERLLYLLHMTELQLLAAAEIREMRESGQRTPALLAELLGKIGIAYTAGPQGFLQPSAESVISGTLARYLAQYRLTAQSA